MAFTTPRTRSRHRSRVVAAGLGVDVGRDELRGASISISVAATIAKRIVNPTALARLVLVVAVLIGAILWNLVT
jgi:hypothetical protein